jgi:glycosyltransferase involved in cell wall biosynthesis
MPAGRIPRFAVVMTVRNNARYIRQAMATILPELEGDGELAMADAVSTDGTTDILREMAGRGDLTLVVEPCTRGKGRDIGVRATRAPVILTQVDADVAYQKGILRQAVEHFERSGKGGMMLVFGRADPNPGTAKLFVWDRTFYLETGGYQDINLHDDMLLLRDVISRKRAWRYLVERVGDDLQVAHGARPAKGGLWTMIKENIRIARVMHGDRWSPVTYLRFLHLTRRTPLRFVLGSGLALLAFVLPSIHLSHETLHQLTPRGGS